MRIKIDFTTNSSSASYMIPSKFYLDDKVKFVKKLNEYFEEKRQKSGWQGEPGPQPSVDVDDVEVVLGNSFVICGYVPYLGDYDDLPKHITNMLLDYMNNPNGLAKFGFKELKFKIKDKNEPQNK
jgi:hypothetical protein